MDVALCGPTTFICPYHIYVVWRLWNGMYSQMHQPDILMMVKECLSVSRESSFIDFTVIFLLSVNKLCYNSLCCDDCDPNLKTNVSFSSYLLCQALFVDLEADFHARVPVVICKEKSRCVFHLLFSTRCEHQAHAQCRTADLRKTPEKWKCLRSGLVCKVSAGNEMAFQTTSFICALSSRERLLLPLVLGLRRWARVGFPQRLGCVGFPQRYKLVWRLARCRCFRSVTLIARRKVDCRRTSSPSWSSSSCNSAGKPSFPLTWNKKWALFFSFFLFMYLERYIPKCCFQWNDSNALIVSRSRFFRSAGCLSLDSLMWRTDTCTGFTRLPPKNHHSQQKTPASRERWSVRL